jgi:hypothetical protein
MTTDKTSSRAMVSVYDGQRCVGFVLSRGPKAGFEAFDANEVSVGFYSTQTAAADAIIKACANFSDAETEQV